MPETFPSSVPRMNFFDQAAAKQEEAMEKVGYKFSKEELEDRDKMKTTHDTMAGSVDAPEFEADAEAAVRVPAFLGSTGMFDASDMNYTKNQLHLDNERARARRSAEDAEVRAFREASAKTAPPAFDFSRPAKPRRADAAAPAPALVKRRRLGAAAAPGAAAPGAAAPEAREPEAAAPEAREPEAAAPEAAAPKASALGSLLAYSDSDDEEDG